MNKIIFFILFIIFIYFALNVFVFSGPQVNLDENPNNEIQIIQDNNIEFYSDYKIDYIEIGKLGEVNLISNVAQKLTSQEAINKYYCTKLVSAGFIDENFKHLGLFIEKSKTISPLINSNLLNGFLSYVNNEWKITDNYSGGAEYAIQSGPLIQRNNIYFNLDNYKSTYERRVLAGLSRSGNLIFLVIYSKKNTLYGPSFSELPDIIDELENNNPIDFVDLINLDGGSHSLFISQNVNIPEISKTGGFFCIHSNF